MMTLETSDSSEAVARQVNPTFLFPTCVIAVLAVLFGLLPIEAQYLMAPSYVTEDRYLQEIYFPTDTTEYTRVRLGPISARRQPITVNASSAN